MGSCGKLDCLHEVDNLTTTLPWKLVKASVTRSLGICQQKFHIPLSLQFGAVIKATLSSTNYRNSPLLQGGLQISCQGSVSMPATLKKANYWKVQRYGQCFVRWTRWLCSTGLISSPYDWDSKTFTKKNLWHCSCHLIGKRRKIQ